MVVRIGSNNKMSGGVELSLKKFHIHPEYLKNGFIVNDIALIELKNEIRFNTSFANSVCSPDSSEQIDRPEMTVFAGWGNTGLDGGRPNNTLKKTFYHTIPPKQCKYKTDYFICVNASQGMGCSVNLLVQKCYNFTILYEG